MRDIGLLVDEFCKKTASYVSEQLLEAGFNVIYLDVHENGSKISTTFDTIENITSIVAIIPKISHSLFLQLSYLLGRGKKIWILYDKSINLPFILRRASCLSLTDKNWCNVLLEQLRHHFNLELPPPSFNKNSDSFFRWLRDEPDRVTQLSPSDFELLVSFIFSNLGFFREKDVSENKVDLIFSDPQHRLNILVECKNYLPDRKIGIGTIEQTVSSAISYRCNLSVLVSANSFTKAALAYSKSCYPPVWLIDRKALESLIVKALGSKFDKSKGIYELFAESSMIPIKQKVASYFSRENNLKPERKSLVSDGQQEKKWIGDWIRQTVSEFFSKQPTAGNHSDYFWPSVERCDIFLCRVKGKSERTLKLNKTISDLVHGLTDLGINVWHDYPQLKKGFECKYLEDVSKAANHCGIFVFFLGKEREQISLNGEIFQTIACELDKSNRDSSGVLFIGKDNLENRLCIPSFYSKSHFGKPSRTDWKLLILDATKDVIKTMSVKFQKDDGMWKEVAVIPSFERKKEVK